MGRRVKGEGSIYQRKIGSSWAGEYQEQTLQGAKTERYIYGRTRSCGLQLENQRGACYRLYSRVRGRVVRVCAI